MRNPFKFGKEVTGYRKNVVASGLSETAIAEALDLPEKRSRELGNIPL